MPATSAVTCASNTVQNARPNPASTAPRADLPARSSSRIREELRAGKSARGAVEAGFGRAFWTVFDAHVTALVAGIVLYSYGTGPIRGFAVTLIIGVIANLFTSVWLSRAMFDFLVNRRQAATLSI